MFPNILHPNEDAYISQYYANSNFGGVPYLYTNRYQGSGDEYQSLLKFNWIFDHYDGHRFRSQLRLKIYRNEIPSSATLLVYRIIGNWNESTVTWNNRPAIDTVPIGSAVIYAGYFGWVDINLTGFADHVLNNGLLLKCDETFNSLLGFYGRGFSDSSYWPQLIPVVAPASDVEKPVVRVQPAPSVVLPSDLVRVLPSDDCDERRFFRYDNNFPTSCRFDDCEERRVFRSANNFPVRRRFF